MKAKKVIIGIMCLSLCFTAMACDNKDDSSTSKSSAATEITSESEKDSSESESSNLNSDGTQKKCAFWTGSIPETLKEKEDSSSESENSSYHVFEALGDDGYAERSVAISIDKEDAIDFRQDLVDYGIDLKDYADGKLENMKIGGYNFTHAEYIYWGDTANVLAARNEGSQMSITITVEGDFDSEDVQSLINSLTFTLPEGSEKDAPYPWDGEPTIAKTGTASIADYKLTAKQLIASESILPNDIFDNRIVAAGGSIYALSDGHLYIFKLNGTNAELQENIELEEDYDHLTADNNGTVYLSGFMSPMIVYRGGKKTDISNVEDQYVVSPDGSFGLEYFTSMDDISKTIIKDDGSVQSEAFSFDTNVTDLISSIFITKDYIIISGSAADDSGHKVFLFDHDGKYLKTLADEDGGSLGSITGAVQTSNGIIALDGNMRSICMWDNDGKFVGEIDDEDLFGTDYPWASGFYQADDGKIYVSMVDERADKSWDEMLMFQLESDF